MLSKEENNRYARQIQLPQVGQEGQLLIKESKVLVVGAGGLGCPVLQYLAAAGIGQIGIADDDIVAIKNLQRQVLFTSADVGIYKAKCAATRLAQLNHYVNFITILERVSVNNVLELIAPYDIIVDASDNFSTKFLLNDACLLSNKPLVYGSVSRFDGQVSIFGKTLSEPPFSLHQWINFSKELEHIPTCATSGVLGVLPSIIGSIQALEVIKIILDEGKKLIGKVLVVDGLNLGFHHFELAPNSQNIVPNTLKDYSLEKCNSFFEEEEEISVYELSQWIDNRIPFQLIDVREAWERDIALLPSIHIPLNTLLNNLGNLKLDTPIVFYCHHGIRSKEALRIAKNNIPHLIKVSSLKDGIDAWSREVDSMIARY
ncbi:MAG: hypothetical protein EAZ07_06880 [Cytophagales bacterium]|nr:MAG: hypothetical protein EAZ07_06880 [Cytophagales bacterium]